jgi:hypothetical protein
MEKIPLALRDKVYIDNAGTIRWKDDSTIVDEYVFSMYNSKLKSKGD